MYQGLADRQLVGPLKEHLVVRLTHERSIVDKVGETHFDRDENLV